MDIMTWIDKQRNWWKTFLLVFVVSVCVVGYLGVKTYQYAPPRANFVDENGSVVFSGEDVVKGQQVFLRYNLMDYGSFLGDGALRGPDFTGEALNLTARFMIEHTDIEWQAQIPEADTRRPVVESLVQAELKRNRYDESYYVDRGGERAAYEPGAVVMTEAEVYAFGKVRQFYAEKFGQGGALAGVEVFSPADYITDPQAVHQLSAFFYWGGWMCAAKRPGFEYSYTHNWPYDPLAGNRPHGSIVMWSILATLGLLLAIGALFYHYGKTEREQILDSEGANTPPLTTTELLDSSKPMPTQRAMYKFFAMGAILFGVQVAAGLWTVADFVSLGSIIGLPLQQWLPVTVSRAWHTQISFLWISICWFAATIWLLPLICRPEPKGQLILIQVLFAMLVVVIVGTLVGIPAGIKGELGDGAAQRFWGQQGWEFMQIGRAYQYVLYGAFVLWGVILARGVWPVLRQKQSWSLPNWMVYMAGGIIFMFTASFVAGPETSFVIADFWRWCTVHMWLEAFFELFTTVIAAYFFYLMGFVSHRVAARVVFLGAVLFLGSGLIGIGHNFYWHAKSIETVALGGVFSSLQIAPLVLLTVEAWRLRDMPDSTLARLKATSGVRATFGVTEAFMFMVAVNFWNFFAAGVLGFMINLPIVNYYEHGTYLTVNHGHLALFGVYGNLAIAAMLFCGRWMIAPEHWNVVLIRTSFWALNIGMGLMGLMDLFPVGIHQLSTVMSEGYAHARSTAYVEGTVFTNLTWLRGIGATIFVVGGVGPLVWFMVSRGFTLKPAQTVEESYVVPATVLALAPGTPTAAPAPAAGGGR